MNLTQEWFTAERIAEMRLPGMPTTKVGVLKRAHTEGWRAPETEGVLWRRRNAKGGGFEFHFSILPGDCLATIQRVYGRREDAADRTRVQAEIGRTEAWAWFEKLNDTKKTVAAKRLEAILLVRKIVSTGRSRDLAICHSAVENGVGTSTIRNWIAIVAGIDRTDWLPYLAPRHVGRTKTAECHDLAYDWLLRAYLTKSKPSFEDCYRKLLPIAAKEGWSPVPSARTMQRRLDNEDKARVILEREGDEALKRLFPAQERDRSTLHALQAVNADGHKFDVFVKYPDDVVGRVMMIAFQDLYSGKILSYRLDRSENKDAVRLAFGDLVEKYGIPDKCLLDNGRAFASKWMSGGIPNRYRFKVKDEDPDGIMKVLGVTIHWATPYHGQAKPIERAFRDFASDISKDIRFVGAYTGNSPVAKPENYGSKAVPFDLFEKVVAQGVAEHNARTGRKAKVCAGRSFDETFAESYEKAPIRKATAEQRRLWLLAAEGVTAAKVDGSLRLLGNRYWSKFLTEYRGKKLVMRFDPQNLHQDMHVYRLDGGYLGAAKCIEAVSFFDTEKAREHAKNVGDHAKAAKALAKAVIKMRPQDAAKLASGPEEPAPPEAKVVRPIFPTRGSAALKPIQQEDDDPREAEMAEGLRLMNRALRGQVHQLVVPKDDDD